MRLRFLAATVLVFCLASPASAQRLYWGFRTGLNMTGAASSASGYNSGGVRFIFGPTVELLLPGSIGVEVDALYKRNQWNSLEVPVIGKRYLRWSGWHWCPYAGGGYAWRWRSGPGTSGSDNGIVAATGLRLRAGHYRIWPEVRYTRWLDAAATLQANQTDLLVGFRFQS